MTNDKLSHARHSSDPDLMDSSSRPPSSPYSQTKPRRPLPVPGEQQPKAIPATYFYNNEAKSSASKPTQIGSTHTSYIAPSSPLPTYRDSTYREPEPIMDDDPVPPLIPATESGWGDTNNTGWENTPSFQWDSTNWASGTGWNTGSSKVIIDGRSDEEEENWCDPELREKCKRPGPGMLPPCLADMLHNPDHTLYSVQATPPVLRQGSTAGPSTPASSTLNFLPPTPEEVRMAIPHPNAYYCKEHNGWVLLNWRSSSILPPLAQSFTPSLPLPDQVRRKKLNSCIGDGEQQSGQTNKTHHFHRYQRAVDARMLTTAYKRTDWEDEERLKSRRRKMTLSIDLDADQGAGETDARGERDDEEPEGELLDLYVCCQCSVYCLASKVIPGVLSQKFVDEFTKDKLSHPALDKTPKTTVLAGWETVLTLVIPSFSLINLQIDFD